MSKNPYHKDTYVYFMSDNIRDVCKIGISRNVLTRMKSLEQRHNITLELMGYVHGSYKLERQLHARFKQYRVNGEWFLKSKEILDYVSANCRKDTPTIKMDAPPPPPDGYSSWDEIAKEVNKKSGADKAWVIGDIVAKFENDYGKSTLNALAVIFGIAYSTIVKYRHMSEMYPPHVRHMFSQFTYTHLAQALVLGSYEAAYKELQRIDAAKCSVVETRKAIRENRGISEKSLLLTGRIVGSFEKSKSYQILIDIPNPEIIKDDLTGYSVKIVLSKVA